MKAVDQVLAEVYPVLESIESERQDYYRRRSNCVWFVIAPAFVFAAILSIAFFPVGCVSLIFAVAISVFAYYLMAGKYAKAYAKNYKQCVISKLAEQIDPALQYDVDRGIDQAIYMGSELFTTRPDRYQTEDLIHGKYGGTGFRLAEIHAEEEKEHSDSKGNRTRRNVTIFKGLMLIADFNKHFNGRTFVLPDVAEKALGGLGRTLQKMSGRSGTDLIQLEDVDFEREFSVHASDQIESRYILSPAMMRRLIDLKERFGKNVRLAFKDSCVYVAVPHSKPYLEPSTRVPATDRAQVENMLEEIGYFVEIIEELDLNTRIWTKR